MTVGFVLGALIAVAAVVFVARPFLREPAPASVRPEEPIDDAEEVMRAHQVRRVPVLDVAGHVVGILSQNDLVREAARQRVSE